MNLNIVSKEKAKTLVSALRRELQALDKGTAALSHNDCLNVLAKAQGFASWNAWEATLTYEKPQPAPILPKYPLTNNGEFDFITPGEEGTPFKGDFTNLDGTFELVEARAYVVAASRAVGPRDKGIGGSGLNVQHGGSSTFDDTMETQVQDKNIMWLPEDGEMYTGPVVLVPKDCDDPEFDETLPVRAKLLEAYLAYYAERGVDDGAREGAFYQAEGMLGVHLTEREREHLLDQLPAAE